MNTPYPTLAPGIGSRPARSRDVTWDRILFQPPALLNPRQVFDPAPFRTQQPALRTRSRPPLPR